MVDFYAEAELIAFEMHNDRALPSLDDEAIRMLADRLRHLSPDGSAKVAYSSIFQRPSSQAVQRETSRLLNALNTISSITMRDTPAIKAAKACLVTNLSHNEGLKASNDLVHLLTIAEQLHPILPTNPNIVVEDPDGEVRKTRLDYKTYVTGFELPHLFSRLYPGEKFGKQDARTEFQGHGVHFVLDCCAVIDLGDVAAESIRKAMERAKKLELKHLY